jgi:hypothetical protein
MKYRIKETGVIVDLIEQREISDPYRDAYLTFKAPDGEQFDSLFCKGIGLTLEPIEEPVKKLRAVREIASGEIKFYDNTLRFVKSDNGPQLRELAPEYDIEYPKENV